MAHATQRLLGRPADFSDPVRETRSRSRSWASRTSAMRTVDRHGWPGTGHSRARLRRHGAAWSPSSSTSGAYGAHFTAGTTGENRLTMGAPTAAARCAGPVFPTTTTSAPARTAASSAGLVRPPRSMPVSPATAAVSVAFAGGAGDDDGHAALGVGGDERTVVGLRPRPCRHARSGVDDHVAVEPGHGRGQDGVVAHREPPVVVRRQPEPGRLGDPQRAFGLGEVLGQVLAGPQPHVEQGRRGGRPRPRRPGGPRPGAGAARGAGATGGRTSGRPPRRAVPRRRARGTRRAGRRRSGVRSR